MVITERTRIEKTVAPQEASSDLLTVGEVADILRVDDTTVRRWIKAGVMEAVCLPHRNKRCAYRVKRITVDKLFGKVA